MKNVSFNLQVIYLTMRGSWLPLCSLVAMGGHLTSGGDSLMVETGLFCFQIV